MGKKITIAPNVDKSTILQPVTVVLLRRPDRGRTTEGQRISYGVTVDSSETFITYLKFN